MKLAINAMLNTVTALTGMRNGAMRTKISNGRYRGCRKMCAPSTNMIRYIVMALDTAAPTAPSAGAPR